MACFRFGAVLLALVVPVQSVSAAKAPAPIVAAIASYADLADLADSAPLVLRAQVRKLVQLEPERAQGIRPGWARFYVEARTRSLLAGPAEIGEALRYLVDLPLDAKGRAPALRKKDVLVFARAVPARPGELQLVERDAQLLWGPALEAQTRAILNARHAADAPTVITGVREAIYVPGTLAGEGETQLFLATRDGSAASITVTHRPGRPPQWGVSFSEVVESEARAPARETLAWYRLACFLPQALPRGSNVSGSPQNRSRAEADYRLVMRDLGPCQRLRN